MGHRAGNRICRRRLPENRTGGNQAQCNGEHQEFFHAAAKWHRRLACAPLALTAQAGRPRYF